MEKHTVYIPKVGTHVDNNAFGGHYVTKFEQDMMVLDAVESWKRTIKYPKRLETEIGMSDGTDGFEPQPKLITKVVANPYFGWKEEQLEIKFR